jgi:hypothetical protein
MRVVNERWNELENELGLGLPINTLSEVDIANKWRLRALNAEKLLNKPQLTIPKSIADELDKYDFELTSKGLMYRNMGGTLLEFSRVTYDEIPQLIVQTIAGNYRIVFAYLAGKALGVDVVKVGGDEKSGLGAV